MSLGRFCFAVMLVTLRLWVCKGGESERGKQIQHTMWRHRLLFFVVYCWVCKTSKANSRTGQYGFGGKVEKGDLVKCDWMWHHIWNLLLAFPVLWLAFGMLCQILRKQMSKVDAEYAKYDTIQTIRRYKITLNLRLIECGLLQMCFDLCRESHFPKFEIKKSKKLKLVLPWCVTTYSCPPTNQRRQDPTIWWWVNVPQQHNNQLYFFKIVVTPVPIGIRVNTSILTKEHEPRGDDQQEESRGGSCDW
jgi:hypothetical protein